MPQKAVENGEHKTGEHHCSSGAKRPDFFHASASLLCQLTRCPCRRDKVMGIHIENLAHGAEACTGQTQRLLRICHKRFVLTTRVRR